MYAANINGRVALCQDDWDGITFLYPKEQGAMAVCGTIEDINDKNSGNFMLSLLAMLAVLSLFHFSGRKMRKY
jgi:hypothetical protein